MTILVTIPLVEGGSFKCAYSKIKHILPVGDFFNPGGSIVEVGKKKIITSCMPCEELKVSIMRQRNMQLARKKENKK